MNPISKACEAYIAMRQAMGFKFVGATRRLRHLVHFMEERGENTLTTSLAVAWAQMQNGRSQAGICYSVARGFARHLAGIDPRTDVPPPGLVPFHWFRRPYLYTDAEVSRLLAATDEGVRKFQREQRGKLMTLLASLRGGRKGSRERDALLLFALERGCDALADGEADDLRLIKRALVRELERMVAEELSGR